MKRRSALLMLLACWAAATLDAQSRWLPPRIDLGANLTGANREAALARLSAIERLVKQVPELAHPDGFDMASFFEGGSRRQGQGKSEHPEYVTGYRIRIAFFYPKRVNLTDATASIEFAINASDIGSTMTDAQGREIVIEQGRWPRWPSSTVTYGASPSGAFKPTEIFQSWAWFTSGREFPWGAVSREDYYNTLLLDAEGKNGETRAAYKKVVDKTGYQRWLEEAPQRKKDREEVLKAVAQLTPENAAKLRKELEDAERQAGEAFKKNESADREDAKTAFKLTDDIRSELSRMTPAQRKLPAIIDTDPSRTEWRATGASMRDSDVESITVHRILTPNYDFWRARKSPAEVHTILVNFDASNAPPPILKAMVQTYKKFDWRALAEMVDQTAKR